MAEPISAGITSFILWASSVTSLSVAQVATLWNSFIIAASSAGVNAYLSSQRELPNQARAIKLGVSPDMPRRWQIGERANAGVLVDWHVHGNKNQFLSLVIYLGEGPMGNLKKIIADGRTVWSGNQDGNGAEVVLTEYNSPEPRAWFHYHDGRVGQTVNSYLNSQYGVGVNYKGTGCAYMVVRLKWDPDTTGSVPQMTFVTEGSMLYDRRKDSTAGGTGTHRLDDPSTWELSDNPAVAMDHYLLGNYWPGLSKPRFGVGLPKDDVPYDRFAALANLCEEQVNLTVGTQQRYTADGFFFSDVFHSDQLIEIAKTMNARPGDFGGKVSAISQESGSSVLTLTDDDVIQTMAETYSPKRSWGNLVGGATGTYQDPNNNYQPAEFPRVADASWEAEDGGETKVVSFDLPFVTDPTRAQRLARMFVMRERRQAVLTGTYGLKALELEEGDWFTRQGARFPSGKVFEVTEPPQFDPSTMSVTMSAMEVDPSDTVWNASDAEDVATPTGDDGNLVIPGLPTPVVTFTTFLWTQGDFSFASIRFDHTEWDEVPLDVDIEIADSDGAGAPDPAADYIDVKIPANRQFGSYNGLLPGKKYVVRARLRGSTRNGPWTSWTEVTASAGGSYGVVGTEGATLGVNIYDIDGVTPLTANQLLNVNQDWAEVGGSGRPADNATVGGTWGLNLLGQPADSNLLNTLQAWSDISGLGIPADYATVGATWGSNLLGQPADADLLNAQQTWAEVGGAGRPADNATVGAIWGSNLLGQPSDSALLNTQQLWAEVSGTGRPADNATVGATWGSNLLGQPADADLLNSYAPLGSNLLYNTKFFGAASPPVGWEWSGYTTTGLTPTRGMNLSASYGGVENVAYVHLAGHTPAAGTVMDLMTSRNVTDGLGARPYRVPVIPNERMYFSKMLGPHRCEAYANAVFYDENGNYVGEQAGNVIASNGGGFGGRPENFENSWGYATVPAGARSMSVFARARMTGGSDPYLFAIWPMVARPPANATGEIPFSHGAGDLRADVTGDSQAASIADQSAWATYTGAIANFTQGIMSNQALNENPQFLDPDYSTGIPPGWSTWVNGAPFSRGTFYNRPVVNSSALNASVPNLGFDQYIYNIGGARKFKARLVWRRNGGSYRGAGMHITQRDATNANLQSTNINCATEADVGGVVSTTHDGVRVWEKIFETPAGTDRILFYAMWAWTGFDNPPDGQGLDASLLECSITPLDETERRTATQTDNADETSQGQAASIADQGALAKSNYYSQPGDPGSVPNGSFWHDSDDDILYMRISGAWEKIADVTPAGGGAFSATVSPGYAEAARFGAGLATTNNVTVSVQGGVGPFTFQWSYPTTTGIGISNLTAATVNFSKNLSANEYVSTTATCTITDTGNGNAITQVQVGVNMVAL